MVLYRDFIIHQMNTRNWWPCTGIWESMGEVLLMRNATDILALQGLSIATNSKIHLRFPHIIEQDSDMATHNIFNTTLTPMAEEAKFEYTILFHSTLEPETYLEVYRSNH